MIKKTFALLLTISLILTLMPAVALAEDLPSPGVSGKNIFANGVPVVVVAGRTEGYTNILYDKNNNGSIEDTEYLDITGTATADGFDLSVYTIFGGAQSGTVGGDSSITIEGGNIGSVYGGNKSYSDMPGGVTIIMNGGSVARILVCGYNNAVGGTGKTVTVEIHGGTVRGGVDQSVNLESRNNADNTSLLIDGGVINGQISVKKTGAFVIKGGNICASIKAGTTCNVSPTDGLNTVYKTSLTLIKNGMATAGKAVLGLTVNGGCAYGTNDAITDTDGKLYAYLPEGRTVTAAITADGNYTGSVTPVTTGNASGDLTINVPLWTDGLFIDTESVFSGGSGTSAKPYLLSGPNDLAQLALNVNNGTTYSGKCFKLTADIDLAGKYWVPIGNGNLSRSFNGVLDGDNHTIRNMAVDDSTFSFNGYARYGFISWMYQATVKNLGLENAEVLVNKFGSTACEAALLTGLMDASCTIENCYAVGTITAMRRVDNIGGLVGKTYYKGTMNNCYVSGTINAAGGDKAGGLIGNISSGAKPSNCYAAASVVSAATDKYAVAASADNCYYLANSETDSIEGTTFKTPVQFSSGEVAWLLNTAGKNYNDDGYAHSGMWSQDSSCPVLASDEFKPIYKVSFDDSALDSVYSDLNGKINLLKPYFSYTLGGFGFTSSTEVSADITVNAVFNAITPNSGNGITPDNYLTVAATRNKSLADITHVNSTVMPFVTNSVSGGEFLGTGSVIEFRDGDDSVKTYTLAVLGDLNGDGVCDVFDCFASELACSGTLTLTGAEFIAANEHEDGTVDANDYQLTVNRALSYR